MGIINQAGGGGSPTGTAGGDLGGTYPNPTVTGGTHLGAATVAIASLADPTTGKVIGSSANAAAAVFPPGYEFGYDQITTASLAITSTTEATGTTVITCGAHTFDGSPVMVEFCGIVCPPNAAAGDYMVVSLFESATQITELGTVRNGTTTANKYTPVCLRYRFTPTAASHTYTVTAFVNVNNGAVINSGSGGTGGISPTFVRFTKV